MVIGMQRAEQRIPDQGIEAEVVFLVFVVFRDGRFFNEERSNDCRCGAKRGWLSGVY